MIPIQFFLFFSGSKLSYLRYLTFKTLRYYHPKSSIKLYTTKTYNNTSHKWGVEKQDFQYQNDNKDYWSELKDLDVEIIEEDFFGDPNSHTVYQSDYFRWITLYKYGGIYLDTDQIILRPFDALPLDREFLFSAYKIPELPLYVPVGVLCAEKESKITKHISEVIPKHLNKDNYNSSGPFMLVRELRNLDLSRSVNLHSSIFYPIPYSNAIVDVYNGTFEIPLHSFALHWFGGHPLSQEFNSKYTEEFAQTSNDSISKLLRMRGVI